MSFILDALKKLERQKQQESESPDYAVMMEGGRRWGQTASRLVSGRWSIGLVALAALALSALALFRTWRRGVSEAPPPLPTAESEVLAGHDLGVSTAPSPAIQPPPAAQAPESLPSVPSVTKEPGRPFGMDRLDQARPPGTAEEEAEPVGPVRLVGRERSRGQTAGTALLETTPDEIPAGLPELVLQGTSVIDGRPIAVINYQRLFEGDLIEGAKIVKISDRVVELEFEGRRFVLRL
ncbi:MAG: hypothetical protein ACE5JI_07830 [Acidobacteriota bacterium]